VNLIFHERNNQLRKRAACPESMAVVLRHLPHGGNPPPSQILQEFFRSNIRELRPTVSVEGQEDAPRPRLTKNKNP
jgi:hypothetical protein